MPEQREAVEVRLVQVPVSVIDPRSGGYASVSGLGPEAFELRVDGKRVAPDRLIVDEICGRASERIRPVFVIVDFNYLDGRARIKVAEALASLAARAASLPASFQVYGLTRQLRALTPEPTRDREALERAAEAIRRTAYRQRPPGPDIGAESEADALFPGASRRGDVDEFRPSYELFGRSEPAGAAVSSFLSAEARLADFWTQARSPYHPASSLAAIEAVMRAHADTPGRKIVLLFTSEAFRFPSDDELHPATRAIRELAGRGYSIWTVDTEGLSRSGSSGSKLLSSLARDTGGALIRKLGDLSKAFDGPVEQLSCYYLLSWKQPAPSRRTERFQLTVKLRSDRDRSLWGLRVVAPGTLTLVDPITRLRGLRIGALLAPQDYPRPPVDVALDFPRPAGEIAVMPFRVRVPLKDLTWLPAPDGGVQSRLVTDAVVEQATRAGIEILCQFGADRRGGMLGLVLPRPPAPSDPGALAIGMECPVKRPKGLVSARAAATDLAARTVGGGRASVTLGDSDTSAWHAFGPRVETASGRDLVWRPGMKTAKRDVERSSWAFLPERDAASPEDRLALAYLLCGPDLSRAAQEVRHALVAAQGDATRIVMSFDSSAIPAAPPGPGCVPVRVTVPEFSLQPGGYAFAILRRGTDASTLPVSAVRGDTPAGSDGVLGVAAFRVGD
ncbi:MAG: hypothetical protein D6718_05595 [Acidobacteria bacterium]|nr:MAG: hypothetical protein D6718_05595 [Acidobacteriota bacterium]